MQYFMPAARCQETGQRIKNQDLTGRRFSQFERQQAWLHAERLAASQSARDQQTWTPELIEYTA
jgi:hypothetical protein